MDQFYDINTGEWNMDSMLAGFIRTFPQATAGVPLSTSFNYTSADFELVFQADTTIEMPTEIAVPAVLYPNGFEVTLSSESLSWQLSSTKPNIVEVSSTQSGTATVTIKRS
jgi:endoglycosylceramidase